MEDKEISLNPPPQPLIKVPQIAMPPRPSYFNTFSRPIEQTAPLEVPKPNQRQSPKNAAFSDLQIEKILSNKLDQSKGQKIFLVKYKNKSYHELKWVTASEFANQKEIMDQYLQTAEENPTEPYFDQNYLIPEKVISVKKTKQQKQYLVKWTDLDYYESTWENENFIRSLDENLVKEFEKRVKTTSKNSSFLSNSQNFHPILENHSSKSGYQLDSCQIDILNFLMNSWCFSQNALISGIEGADVRPGVVNFLEKVIFQGKGSFLIVSDESLIEKWESDISEWTNIPFITFIGKKENLDIIKKYEFSKPGSNDEFIYPIYITTCHNLLSYNRIFSQATWECIILDDSQRDNVIFDKSILNQISSKIKTKYRVFMTPPLEEVDPHYIWPWLNFVDPNNFHLESRFTKSFCKEGKIEIEKLNNNSSFAHFDENNNKQFELTEIFVKCPLTDIQEESIKNIYEPFINELDEDFTKNGFNMRKIVQSTRKVLDHPFLLKDIQNKVQQENKKSFSSPNHSIYDSEIFLKSSGKLFVLDILLKKFKSESKNVVIICQTSDSIEILEKYMLAKFYSYEKVDLFRRGRSRYEAVMQFNDESKRIFAFILDAKTGYFAMKADYVVIYESDWNPRNDIFIANKILTSKSQKDVYRLVTSKTFEIAFINDFHPEPIQAQEISKLSKFGYDLLTSNEEEIKEENEKLLQFLNSEQPDIDFLLENHTLLNHYKSIKEMSDTIPIEKWIQLEKKMTEKNEDGSEKVEFEKKNLEQQQKDVFKSSENDDEDDDDDENENNSDESAEEEEEFNELDYNETELKGDSIGWTPKLIFHLFNSMLKYGPSMTDDFSKSIPLEPNEIMKTELILICSLFQNCENNENFMILQNFVKKKIHNVYFSEDDRKLNEEKFTTNHQKEIQKIASSKTDWKLDRLEFLLILDVSFHAREISNGEKTIPSFRPSTLENDNKIIEIVKKKGFPIKKLTSSLKNMKMTLKKANSRAVNLIEELKEIFLDFCQTFELEEDLTPEKLIDSLKMLNTKEKKKIFQAIHLVGIDDLEAVFEASKLKKDRKKIFMKYMDQFKKFAHSVIRNKKVPFDFFGAHYSLKTLTEGIFNIAILKYLREIVDINNFPEKDRPLFEYLIENGFKNIKKEEIFQDRFSEPIEQSLDEFLHSYFNAKKRLIFNNFFKGIESPITSPVKQEPFITPISSIINPIFNSNNVNKEDADSKLAVLSKYIDFNLPEGAVFSDKEINSMLPIKINENTIITNLGKVVTDRPNFHSERYLYLDGYTAERYFTSVHDPSKKEWYILRIEDTGSDYPLFTVESKNDPSIRFEGNAPSKPSIELLKKITAVKNKSKASSRSPTISGPEFFGFATPKIRKIMERLPGANKCPRFKGISSSYPSQDDDLKKVKSEDMIPEKREVRTRNTVFVIDDDQTTSEYNSDFEKELEDDDEIDDDDDGDDDENEEEEEENEDDEDESESEYDHKSKKNHLQSKSNSSTSTSTSSTSFSKRKTRKRKGQSDYDDADYGEDNENDDSNDSDDDYDNKSLVQRVKERYLKGRIRSNRLEKRYNLRKRVKRKNYNEYEEDENEEEEYDEENEYDDDDENENEEDEEEEEEKNRYHHRFNLKTRKNQRKQIKKDKKSKNFYNNKDDDDDYDDYAGSANDEYESNFYNSSNLNSENESKSKISPSKAFSMKSKDKKIKTGVTHLSDSSDENYYDFACNNIPDMFSEEKINLGSKSHKNNVLNSSVVFYFDKLTKKPEKDMIRNYFGDDSNMLLVDSSFLEEFVSKNPQFSHYFSNK